MRNDTAAKVAAWNELGQLHNRLVPEIFKAAESLLRSGKKIFKADGTLTEAAKAFFPELSRLSYQSGEWVELKVCHVQGEVGFYTSRLVWVFRRKGSSVELETPPAPMRTDWTVEEVQRLRADVDKAEKAFNEARGRLEEFGRY